MKWPSGMEPANVAVYARNEIEIAAPPERVWRWLIGGERWPRWYGNCTSFRYIEGRGAPGGEDRNDGPDLTAGSSFDWRTFGARVHSAGVRAVPRTRMGRARDRTLRLSWMDAGAGRRRMPRGHRGDGARMVAGACAMVPAPDAHAGPSAMARGSAPRVGVGRPVLSRRRSRRRSRRLTAKGSVKAAAGP